MPSLLFFLRGRLGVVIGEQGRATRGFRTVIKIKGKHVRGFGVCWGEKVLSKSLPINHNSERWI